MIEKRVIDKKRIRKIDSKHEYSGIEHEYNRYRENKRLTPKEDHLYMFFVSVSDKEGMSYYSGFKIQKYIGIGWDTFIKSMEKLSNLGLIKYEKRENHIAVQVMQVPEWEVAKHRFIEVKVESNLSPNEIADKLKLFDDAIKDPGQAPYRQSLETARTEFLKGLSKPKRT